MRTIRPIPVCKPVRVIIRKSRRNIARAFQMEDSFDDFEIPDVAVGGARD